MEQNAAGDSRLILEQRTRLSLTGVTDIVSFDDNSVCLETSLGGLLIDGSGLHITDYSLERSEITVEGTVSALTYSDAVRTGGFLRRIFG